MIWEFLRLAVYQKSQSRLKLAVPAVHIGPESFHRYYAELMPHLQRMGVELGSVSGESDVFWNPFTGWGEPPELPNPSKKLWVTFHGGAAFSKPLIQVFGDRRPIKEIEVRVAACFSRWGGVLPYISGVIVPSQYGAQEFRSIFTAENTPIHVIPHGVNHEIFFPTLRQHDLGFLHVSTAGPVKNLNRIIEAYIALPEFTRPPLTMVVPSNRITPWMKSVPGIRYISIRLSPMALADLYRRSIALVHPSLWETFGLTIPEAMACGCPVIAGNNSAMRELFAGAALLVDPLSVSEITAAMQQLCDFEQHALFQQAALNLAVKFSWEKSAKDHVLAFRSIS